jgi:dTDP-glucose 4,6-dehydratase
VKTILITGGAGFIGSNFVRYVYNKYSDYRIIVLDILTYAGSVKNLPDDWFDSGRVEFWYGDVCNAEIVNTLVERSDVVIHFAAESHVTRSIYDNLQFFKTDVIGTQVVSNAVLKYKDSIERFIHISTSEVYGTAESNKMDEYEPLNPCSPYAAAKCGADRLVYSYYKTYDIPAIIVRPFNNYGPYQHLEKLIPRFITSCILNESLTVHGDGSAVRDWLHVDDHCRALDLIVHADINKLAGEVINLGTEQDTSISRIADIVVDQMGYDRNKIITIGDRPGQVFRHTCDSTKAKKLLGWKSSISLEDGMHETISWYKNNTSWWESQLWMRQIPIITNKGKKEMH